MCMKAPNKNIKPKRQRYTFKQKAGAPVFSRKHPYVSQDAPALQFKMPKGTINEIINNPKKYEQDSENFNPKNKKKHPK